MASLIQAILWARLFSKGQGQSDLLDCVWGVHGERAVHKAGHRDAGDVLDLYGSDCQPL